MAPDSATVNHLYDFARNGAVQAQSQSLEPNLSLERNSQLQELLQDLSQQSQTERRALRRVGRSRILSIP